MGGRVDGWVDGRVDRWTDEWMDGWKGGWTDGWDRKGKKSIVRIKKKLFKKFVSMMRSARYHDDVAKRLHAIIV